jgi:hypothetical protein
VAVPIFFSFVVVHEDGLPRQLRDAGRNAEPLIEPAEAAFTQLLHWYDWLQEPSADDPVPRARNWVAHALHANWTRDGVLGYSDEPPWEEIGAAGQRLTHTASLMSRVASGMRPRFRCAYRDGEFVDREELSP